MAKFYGNIGFSETVETEPGVWTPRITTKKYSGDVLQNVGKKYQETANLNDDLNITMRISIIVDAYASLNFPNMKYVEYLGSKWKISKIDIEPPRQIISIGGFYNG